MPALCCRIVIACMEPSISQCFHIHFLAQVRSPPNVVVAVAVAAARMFPHGCS